MINLEIWAAGAILIALIVYMLTGGADFGGGVWDIFARGVRAERQKRTITNAIAPIWEANHVWLIVTIVLLFMAFSKAFALICIALHIPLTLILLGIVMRGSAFVFRSQFTHPDTPERRWSRVFSIASLLTPVFLGIVIGALASGRLPASPGSGSFSGDFIFSWFAPFPILTGFLTLSLFAFLAASYLTLESREEDLQNDFRNRALVSWVALWIFAWIAFFVSGTGAPMLFSGLSINPWSVPFHIATGIAALGAAAALWKRWYHTARILAVIQAALIPLGWAMSQYPHLIYPHLTLSEAAPAAVLRPVLIALLAGSFLLLPSFAFLFYVFKRDALRIK